MIVPAGFGLQVELEGADAPATLETQTELTADPALSRFHLHRPLVEQALLKGATELWLRSDAPIEIAPDDRLLLAAPDAADPDRLTATQIVVVDEVSSLHGATIVALKGALQLDYPGGAVAYRLGRSFRHFGHSAPAQDVRVDADGNADATDVVYCRSLSGQTSIGSGALRALDLPLDAAIDDFVAGREVICSFVGVLDRPAVRHLVGRRDVLHRRAGDDHQRGRRLRVRRGDVVLRRRGPPGPQTATDARHRRAERHQGHVRVAARGLADGTSDRPRPRPRALVAGRCRSGHPHVRDR